MVEKLAGGNFLDFEKALQIPYQDAMTKLWIDKEKHEYQRRLQKVMENKARTQQRNRRK